MMTGNAVLSSNNFKIIEFAHGTSTTTHILGIGGLSSDALVLEAKRNLLRSSPLRKGQALANITVDFKRAYYFLVNKTTVTVTADIVDFNNDPDLDNEIEEFNNQLQKDVYKSFDIGEDVFTVVLDISTRAKLLAVGKFRCTLMYDDINGGSSTEKVMNYLVFKSNPDVRNKTHFGYDIGDKVKISLFKDLGSGIQKISTIATILGLSDNNIYVEFVENGQVKKAEINYSSVIVD